MALESTTSLMSRVLKLFALHPESPRLLSYQNLHRIRGYLRRLFLRHCHILLLHFATLFSLDALGSKTIKCRYVIAVEEIVKKRKMAV